MNRTDIYTGQNWQPTKNNKVCSHHFLDGFPSSGNPDPSINLGKLFVVILHYTHRDTHIYTHW